MEDLQCLRDDVKAVKQEIAALIQDLLAAYPGTSIDYGSIWLKAKNKKGVKKVKVRLDIKV